MVEDTKDDLVSSPNYMLTGADRKKTGRGTRTESRRQILSAKRSS